MTTLAERADAVMTFPGPLIAAPDVASSSPTTLAPFPLQVLPEPLRGYVRSAARSVGVPPETVAIPLLAILGSLMGNRIRLQLKAGYHQYPAVWIGIVAGVGDSKSPALQAATWPLNELQAQAKAAYDTQREDHTLAMEAWQAKSPDQRGTKPEPPRLRHYMTTNVTMEALTSILETSPGVAIVLDELAALGGSFDAYRAGRGADRQQYLALHSGAPIKVDRRTGEPVWVANPVASIVGGVQPAVLESIGGSRRDGLLERFLLIRPEFGLRMWTDEGVDLDLRDAVTELLANLDRIPSEGWTVQLRSDARDLWRTWYDQNGMLLAEATGPEKAFWAKLPNNLARLALVLHCANNPDDPRRLLEPTTMAAAIDLIEWLRTQIRACLPLLGRATNEFIGPSARILRILRTDRLQDGDGWVRRSDLLNRLRNVSADDLSLNLEMLEQDHAIERLSRETATKPVELWRIRHSVYSDFSENRPQSGENPNLPNSKTPEAPSPWQVPA